MYSRYHNRSDAPLRVPEHYSGYAFSERTAQQSPPHHIDVAKPTFPPPANETPMPAPPRPALPPPPQHHVPRTPAIEEPCEPTPPVPFLPGFGQINTKNFPFGHGIGFEELLLIGLIVLLSGSEGGSDMVLWLALLLFLG